MVSWAAMKSNTALANGKPRTRRASTRTPDFSSDSRDSCMAGVVEATLVVPGEGPAQPLVHADVEVEHDEDGGLQAVGEVEGEGAELEALGRILGEQQRVLGVAVTGVGGQEDVGLLGARRHAGG